MFYVITIIYFPAYFIGNRRKTDVKKGLRGLLREARCRRSVTSSIRKLMSFFREIYWFYETNNKKGYLGITLLVLVGIGFLDPNLKSFFKPPRPFPLFFLS